MPSCRDAVDASIKAGEIVTFEELVGRIKDKGKSWGKTWSDDTIYQHLMGLVVNLPPAPYHWPQFDGKQFLFLHEDGRYERYDPDTHTQCRPRSSVGPMAQEKQESTSREKSPGVFRRNLLKRGLLVLRRMPEKLRR